MNVSTVRSSKSRSFPKTGAGYDPLTGAPTPMPVQVLREQGIQTIPGVGG